MFLAFSMTAGLIVILVLAAMFAFFRFVPAAGALLSIYCFRKVRRAAQRALEDYGRKMRGLPLKPLPRAQR